MVEIKWINECPSEEINKIAKEECELLIELVKTPADVLYHVKPLSEDIDSGPGLIIYGDDSINTFYIEFKNTLEFGPAENF